MISFWERETLLQHDFIVVGAGIVGLSTAAALLEVQPKARVLILERGLLPAGASTRNAGFTTLGCLSEILADRAEYGDAQTAALVCLRHSGLQYLRRRLGDESIGYEPSGNYELLMADEEHVFARLSEVNTFLKDAFKEDLFRDQSSKIPSYGFPSGKVKYLVHCPHAGLLDTGKLMQALQQYVCTRGATLRTGATVESFEETGSSVAVTVSSQYSPEKISFTAGGVAICTNAFSKSLVPGIPYKPGRGQVVVTTPLDSLPFYGGFHFDCGYFYFRSLGNRVLLGGGRNLDVAGETTTESGCTDIIQQALQYHLSTLILPGREWDIDCRWSGIMAFGEQRMPTVRSISTGVCAGIALGGMGVAIGSEVGQQLAAILLGKT